MSDEERLARIEESIASLATLVEKSKEEPAPPEPKGELRDRLWDNPESALDELFEEKSKPIIETINSKLQQISSQTSSDLKQKLPAYQKYPEEFDKLLENVPPEMQGNAELLEQVSNNIKGAHIEDFIPAQEPQDKGTFVEIPVTEDPEGPKTKVELSDAQRAEARKQGISDEEYAKWLDPEKVVKVGQKLEKESK